MIWSNSILVSHAGNITMVLVLSTLPTKSNTKLYFWKCSYVYYECSTQFYWVLYTKVLFNFHKVLDVVNPRITHGQIKLPLGKLYHPASESFFVKDCVIIDCTGFLLNSLLIFLPEHRSNFKHHSTIEYLIITPQGTISYASHCAVGRISDKEIVEQSHLINYLLPGDTIISIRWACPYHSSWAQSGLFIIIKSWGIVPLTFNNLLISPVINFYLRVQASRVMWSGWCAYIYVCVQKNVIKCCSSEVLVSSGVGKGSGLKRLVKYWSGEWGSGCGKMANN